MAQDLPDTRRGGKPLEVTLVSSVAMNPYAELLRRALDEIPGVSATSQPALTPGWVWSGRRGLGVIHLHWIELQVASPSRYRRAKKFARVAAALLLAKALGITLVYTVHNIQHHEGEHALLNRWANRLVFWLADDVHAHDATAAREVASHFGRTRGIYIVPHGNYIGVYPPGGARSGARASLGLSASGTVFLCLGQVRPYKGIEELLAAFRRLPDAGCALVVAGHPQDRAYASAIERLAAEDGRVHLRLEYVPDAEVGRYMAASDVAVLPYREVTTSGAALLAFSFGVPVVAPRIGTFPELVGETRGVLYDPQGANGLYDALHEALHLDRKAAAAEALRFAESLGWDRLARQHLAAYRRARGSVT